MVKENSSLLSVFPCDITKKVEGRTELLLTPSDIEWDMPYTSYATEFDLYCDLGSRKSLETLLSSFYFVGEMVGLIMGSFLYDNIGRKKTSILGCSTVILSTFLGTFCHNYYFLLVIRFLQGIGSRITITGMYILLAEILPVRYRNLGTFWLHCVFALGYPAAACVGYIVKDWNYMFLVTSVLQLVCNIQVFLCIESPRYYLIRGNEKLAKRSLQALSALTSAKFDIENVELEDLGKTQDRKQSFRQQLVDFKSYPSLVIETLIQMLLWFVIGMSYYGFNFGWGSIVPDRYIGYVMGGLGHFLGSLVVFSVIGRLGRRRAMILMLLGATVFYLAAIPDVKLGQNTEWTLESVSSLVGVLFISGSLAGIYLWSAELAPTSHRGIVMSAGSSVARVGSFLGPYIFLNLKPVTHKAVPFGGLAFLTLLCALGSFLLVETGDKETPLDGEDIARRRRSHKYRL